jgi:Cu/Ag efflux pump CusA
MISFIVRQSIRFPGVVVALALTVVLYGFYVLTRANLDVFPEFSPSQVVIQTEAPGLSAELVERQVTSRSRMRWPAPECGAHPFAIDRACRW